MPTQSDVVLIGPTQAKSLLQSNYSRQRKRREWHVQELANEAVHGRIIPGTPINIGVMSGREYLLNGQHILGCIVETGQPLLLTVIRHVVSNDEEMADWTA